MYLACVTEVDGPFPRTCAFTHPCIHGCYSDFTLNTLFVFAGQVLLRGLCSYGCFPTAFTAPLTETVSREQRVQSFEDQLLGGGGRKGGGWAKTASSSSGLPSQHLTVYSAHFCVLIPSTTPGSWFVVDDNHYVNVHGMLEFLCLQVPAV